VPLLDYLLRMRNDLLVGRFGMHLGEPHVERMQGFITGYNACMVSNGTVDAEYGRFREWLRERGEFPPEGWAAKYLRDCHSDHEQAIRKYLDFVAEFVALHRR
jgi:hypothetical protein